MFKQTLLGAITLLTFNHAVLATEPAEVMIMGTFHFSNPGLDTVKTDQVDVSTKEHQAYLQTFSHKIATQFKPTHVLVECPPTRQSNLDKEFEEYIAGEFDLPINETYQLGFRIAGASTDAKVVCFDDKSVAWQAGPMMEFMSKNAPEDKQQFDHFIEKITGTINQMHQQLSLPELLKAHNQKDFDDLNKSFYIQTNHVGAGDGFSGANSSASWWHRNFKMYANIQQVSVDGTRVFVLAGQGHTAILKDFLALDDKRKRVDVVPYF